MATYKFELTKWIRNSKNLIVLVLVVLALFVSLSQIIKKEPIYKKNYLDNIELNYNNVFSSLNMLSIVAEEQPDDNSINEKLNLYDEALSAINDEYIYYEDGNLKKALKSKRIYLEIIDRLIKQGEDIYLDGVPEDISYEVIKLNVFIDRNILPVLSSRSALPFHFLKLILENTTGIIGTIIIILFCFDFFCTDLNRKTRYFLFTQPFKRFHFFQEKFKVLNSVLFIILVSISFIFIFTCRLLSLSFDRLDYPIAVQGNGIDKLKVLSLANYLGIQFFFCIFIIIFVILMIWLLSFIFKNSITVLLCSLSITIVPFLFIEKLSTNYEFLKFTPYYYFSISDKISDAFIEGTLHQFVTIGISTFFISNLLFFLIINSSKSLLK